MQGIQSILASPAEMSERVAAFDWNATPLGERRAWPCCLRVSVETMLANRFPQALLWGSEFILIYNDACRLVIDARNPRAVGLPLRDAWSDFFCLHAATLDRVAAGESALLEDQPLALDRTGTRETAWFTLCFCPVRDDAGAVAGVLLTMIETTGRVLSERRARTEYAERRQAEQDLSRSEDRLRTARLASALGIHEWDIASGHLHWDERVRELWGIGPDEPVTYDTFLDGLHPDDRAPTQAAVDRALDPGGDGRYDAHYRVISRRDGLKRWIAATGVVSFEAGRPVRLIGTVQDITTAKRNEEALRETSQRWSSIVSNSPLALIEWDSEYRVAVWSREAERLFGWTQGEIIGKRIDEVRWVHEQDWPLVERLMDRMNAGGDPVTMNTNRNYRRDGTVIECEWYNSVIYDAAGRHARVISLVLDVTNQNRAAEMLRESEERFRTMADGLPLIVWVHDDQGRQQMVNRTFREFFGIDEHDALGEGWQILMHPDDAPAYTAEFMRCACERTPFHGETRVRRADGAWRWIESWGRPRRSASGEFLGFVGTSADVTERKQMEDELRASRLFYQQTLESIPGMVFTTRPDGYCDYQSRQWVEYTGVPMSQHTGDGWNSLLHPEDRPRAMQAWHAAVEGRAPYDLEYRVRRRDGKYEWFKVIGRPIRDASGHIVRWFGVAANIHQLKEAEAALNAAKAAAEAASAAKDHFLAVLSHELRTPLAPVLLTASALEADAQVPEWLREDMAMIRRSVDLEVRLIDDLLDLNRIARGKLSLRREPVEAHDKVLSALEICRFDSAAQGLTVEIDLRAERCRVSADAGRLHQVFWNLLKNAIKFTPRGGHIVVRSSNPEPQTLRVEVCDNGVGISPDLIPALFDAFQQGGEHVTRRYGGLGLGLAIARALVELHGGRIAASSDGPGKGSLFTVDLPLLADPEETKAARPGPDAASARPLAVLLVEDHEATAYAIGKLLTRAGHRVRTAGSVREAIETAGSWEFDVLLSDLGLPDGSGLEVMTALRARRPDVRGIALSGYGMEHDLQRSREAGFLDHLTKPVEFKALCEALDRAGRRAQ